MNNKLTQLSENQLLMNTENFDGTTVQNWINNNTDLITHIENNYAYPFCFIHNTNTILLYEKVTWAVNQAKWDAARQWCKKNGYTFLILNEKHLN